MQPEAQFAMPELPDHVFVEHILRKSDDPLDLARIRAVSRPMRDAVGVRGHRLKNYGEMTDDDHEYRPAAYLGYLSTLKHVYRQGHLFNRQYKPTFNAASQGGHLEVLKWLRSIGSQMNEVACSFAAFWRATRGVEVVARERLPVEREYVHAGGVQRSPRGAAVGARERLPVERKHVLVRGDGRAPQCAAVVTLERLPVERADVRVRGEGRAP